MEDLTSLASEVRSFVDGTAAVDKTKSIKQGVLTKQGAVIKNWKKRHCIIAQGALLYYKDGQVSTIFLLFLPFSPQHGSAIPQLGCATKPTLPGSISKLLRGLLWSYSAL